MAVLNILMHCMNVVCSKSYDAIDYDEYLDGGIPDTLLQGLGFYANSGDAEKTSEADEVLDESPKPETVTEPHSVSAESSTTTGTVLFDDKLSMPPAVSEYRCLCLISP